VRVSVIIPTRNEAQAIGRVIRDLPADLVTEVIVVDNNSTDGTPEIAARMGARVMTEPRRGYGQACRPGSPALARPMLSYSLTAITAIGLVSFRFSLLRLPRGAPTSPSVRVSRVRARRGRCPGRHCSAIGLRPA
jgi:glycosyltransferase involved in cell wall biosynthesis